MFNGWPCIYWPSYLYCQHAPCDGYNPPQLLALSHSRVRCNNCFLWVECEYLSGGVHLSCPSTLQLLVTPGPYLNVTTFQSQCPGPEVLGHVLSHNTQFFLGQVVIQVRGGKEVVHVQFMPKSFYTPCQISHCSVCCCKVLFDSGTAHEPVSHVQPQFPLQNKLAQLLCRYSKTQLK